MFGNTCNIDFAYRPLFLKKAKRKLSTMLLLELKRLVGEEQDILRQLIHPISLC